VAAGSGSSSFTMQPQSNLQRSSSFTINSSSAIAGTLLVITTSSSDVLTKLVFQMLGNAEERADTDFAVSPTAAILIVFTVVIAFLAVPGLLYRIILNQGCPESVKVIGPWLWPVLGLVMLMQILMAAMTFVFLPAAVVSSLNIGLSILLTAFVRTCRHKQRYPSSAWVALAVIVIGCVSVAVEHYMATPYSPEELSHSDMAALRQKYIMRAASGFMCVFMLASSTALAGTLDDWLTKDKGIESDFLAMAQASSASVYVLIAVCCWMRSTGATPGDVLVSLAEAWTQVPGFPTVAVLCVIAQFALKILAVFVTSLSSAVAAQVFLAVSMCSTWLASSALHWCFPMSHIGDTIAGIGALFRAAGMLLILTGMSSFLGLCKCLREDVVVEDNHSSEMLRAMEPLPME